MELKSFAITSIGPSLRQMDELISRCHAELSLANAGDQARSVIAFDLVYRGSDSETIEIRDKKILVQCVRLLKEGSSLLEGISVESLQELSDENAMNDPGGGD